MVTDSRGNQYDNPTEIFTHSLLATSLILSSCFTLAQAADIEAVVKAAYDKYKGLDEGANADYIPALAKVEPAVGTGPSKDVVDHQIYLARPI